MHKLDEISPLLGESGHVAFIGLHQFLSICRVPILLVLCG